MVGEGAVMLSSPAAGVPHAAAVCVARVCTPRDLVFSENRIQRCSFMVSDFRKVSLQFGSGSSSASHRLRTSSQI